MPHAAPHNYIGEHMATHYSLDDPLFFMHHANVDRLWAVWQDYNDHDLIDKTDITSTQYSSAMDTAMPYTGASVLDFTNGANTPTARDMHESYNDVVSVQYGNDNIARLLQQVSPYTANNNWVEVATAAPKGPECSTGPTPAPTPAPPTPAPTPAPPTTPAPTPAPNGNGNGNGKGKGRRLLQEQGNGNPDFGSQRFNDKWAAIRAERPEASSLDVLRQLAKDDCEDRGNPVAASMEWIIANNMQDHLAAFQCFH